MSDYKLEVDHILVDGKELNTEELFKLLNDLEGEIRSNNTHWALHAQKMFGEGLMASQKPELFRKIQADSARKCADYIGKKSTNPMLTADNEQFYIDCAEHVYEYADKLQADAL